MENQIPLEKLNVSKDIIAQCKKEERVFSPFEQAECIAEGFLDDSDMCLRVYYITYYSKRKMKTFVHRHQNILELERVELPENEKDGVLLKATQALLIGKGDLDTFLYYMMECK